MVNPSAGRAGALLLEITAAVRISFLRRIFVSNKEPSESAMLEVFFEVLRSNARGSFLLAALVNGAGKEIARPSKVLST